MKSFGMWYSSDEAYGVYTTDTTDGHDGTIIDSETRKGVDLHINLWNIGKKPFLDIGLRIRRFRNFNQLFVLIPFHIKQENISDLSCKMKVVDIANLVFNDACRMRTEAEYTAIEYHEETEKPVLLYSFTQAVIESDKDDCSIVRFDFNHLKEDEKYCDFEDVYIRFRIQSDLIEKCLFSSIKCKNWFLESAFNSTQIIDVKVNKKRNIKEELLRKIRINHHQLLGFRRIDFLIMEPANHELEILGEDFSECRQLEDGWGDYLPESALKKQEYRNVLVYHWEACNEENELKEYAKMVKVTKATTSFFIIFIYIIVGIVLGIVTNTIFQILWNTYSEELISAVCLSYQYLVRIIG